MAQTIPELIASQAFLICLKQKKNRKFSSRPIYTNVIFSIFFANPPPPPPKHHKQLLDPLRIWMLSLQFKPIIIFLGDREGVRFEPP